MAAGEEAAGDAGVAVALGAGTSVHDQVLSARFFDLLSHIYQHVRAGPLDLWEDLELTRAQMRTLTLLAEGPDRMTSIAARLGISLPAATGLIDRLVAKDLVERERDPADRRAVVCAVAPEGWRTLESFTEVGRDEFEEVVRFLTPDELEQVVVAVALVVDAIDRAEEERKAAAPAGTEAASGARRGGGRSMAARGARRGGNAGS